MEWIVFCIGLILVPLMCFMGACTMCAFVYVYTFVPVEAVRFLITRRLIGSWGSLGLILATLSVVAGFLWQLENARVAAFGVLGLLFLFSPVIRFLCLIKQNAGRSWSEESVAYGLVLGAVSLFPLGLLGMYLLGLCHRLR